ncbi:MATE family efflux transporter [Mesomycoplasma molare]|uniref:Probable multidrug resistance protein NorM n=1 Tax=Mesomycoplasma molare TaxID=171288 RepID=A0ABY5TUX0_9BACT|nr:MATE family efflux transporter [Mesomycoplasma molare]UWD34460.1 MATE family efflux transporter [Mesomycoplasma molare]
MLEKKWVIFLKNHFPENKKKWLMYFKFSLPIIITGFLFSLNGFIDNFMVTTIPHGVDSLSYANSWTGIVGGVITGISFVCSGIIGQYWGSKNYNKTKEVMRVRVLLTFISVTIFSLFSLFFSKNMISVFYQIKQDEKTLQQSIDYLRLIVITWIIFAWTSPMSSLLTETGHGKEALISSIGSLLINIILNILLIHVFNLGVKGAAFASIAARIFGIFGDTFFVYKKVRKALINPFSLLEVSKDTWKKIFIRIHSVILISSNTILIILRNILFNKMYPQGTIGNVDWAIGAAAILGLTGAISEMFLAVFGAITSNISGFVGKYLGKKEFEIAKKNANELKGFHTIVAFILSFLLLFFSLLVPHINYFAAEIATNSSTKEQAKILYLSELQKTLLVIVVFNPIWIWFSTSSRLIASGGRTNLVAILEFCLEFSALLWLIFITFVIKPQDKNISLSQTYWIFFLIDLVKFLVFEIVYLKVDWAKHIDDPLVKRKLFEKNVNNFN